MTNKLGRNHVVVDGSNIATEGRSMPSLSQLNDAVMAFIAEHPDITVTVVVDATFGHRIDKSEVKEFDAAVSNNELVAPPAGAVGRGDAFVLSIANKAGAIILSNDSFQEFHGDYDWLFDEGRLIGGKPVPHVGWVFVPRVPVRGPISRKATRGGKQGDGRRAGRSESAASSSSKGRPVSKEASLPMPVPKAPPPRRQAPVAPAAAARVEEPAAPAPSSGGSGGSSETVNDLMPFLDFVEHHPVGTSVNATVETYSSHGAYVRIGNVRGYIPLRLMSDPPPRSAREVMKIGDAVTLVVASFAPARRSIDCALPAMATGVVVEDPTPVLEAAGADARGSGARRSRRAAAAPATEPAAKPSGRGRKRAAAPALVVDGAVAPAVADVPAAPAVADAPVAPARARRAPAKAASDVPATPVKKAAAARKGAATTAARKPAPSKQAAATAAPAAPAPADKIPVEPAPVEPGPDVLVPAQRATAKKVAAKKAPAKTAAKTAGATKASATKPSASSKSAAKKATAKKATAKQPATKQAAPRPRKAST